MKTVFNNLLILTFTMPAFAEPEIKGGPEDLRRFLHPKDRVVTITASAEEKAYSDRALISLVISTEAKLLSVAIAKNSQLREAISQQLVAVEIPAKNIQSSKFSTSPQYGWFGDKPSSYKVVNRMAVTIDEETQLQEIAAVADANNEVELSDTSFEHSKKEQFKLKVKKKALDKVMSQKAFYESSLGVKLTPINFREGQVARRATRGAAMLEEVVVTASKRTKKSYDTSVSDRTYRTSNASFDEVKYKTDLYVDFKIEPKP